MPRKKTPIPRIIDKDGNAYVPPEHKKHRICLEREAEKDKKRILEEQEAIWDEEEAAEWGDLNTQKINEPPPGPWVTCPPKTGPEVMLVLDLNQKGGRDATQSVYPRTNHPEAQRG